MKKKKALTLASLLLAFALNASAEGYGVFMEINMKNRNSYTKVNRVPKRISLDVVYDEDAHCISVKGDEDIEVEVFLYNSLGEVEDHSSSINSNLMITSSGSHRILIESEYWIAEGVIEI